MKNDINPVDDSALATEMTAPIQAVKYAHGSVSGSGRPRSYEQDSQRIDNLKLKPYKRTKTLLIATVLLQTALICVPAIPRALILNTGKTVVLKTVPVDPHDMFRGDYISLKYDISTAASSAPNDSDVYVVLEPRGAYWSEKKICLSKPIIGANEVMIKGQARYGQIHYGIEQVYVPDTKGAQIERSGNLNVTAKVDDNGTAVLQRVQTNAGETVYDAKTISLFGG